MSTRACFVFKLPHGEPGPEEAEDYANEVLSDVAQRIEMHSIYYPEPMVNDVYSDVAEVQIVLDAGDGEEIDIDAARECLAVALGGEDYTGLRYLREDE